MIQTMTEFIAAVKISDSASAQPSIILRGCAFLFEGLVGNIIQDAGFSYLAVVIGVNVFII